MLVELLDSVRSSGQIHVHAVHAHGRVQSVAVYTEANRVAYGQAFWSNAVVYQLL